MKKKIKIIILLAVLLANNHVYAQNAQDTQNSLSQAWLASRPTVLQSSPQSAVFEQYTKHEVSECNGLPQISIPLYTISIKGLEIPVSLNYHASGIKFRQYDGDVGAGWSLSVGGYRVSRTVNGFVDELKSKVQLSEYENYKEITDQNREAADAFFANIGGNWQSLYRDAEYDMFTYMLPSSTGHYVLDYESTPSKALILEPNLDKIALGNIPHNEGNKYGFSDWTITDGSGFKYFMGSPEGLEPYIERNFSQTKGQWAVGWPLRRIESPYKQVINFSYVNNEKYVYPNNYSLSNLNVCEASGIHYPDESGTSQISVETTTDNGSYTPYNNKMSFIQSITAAQETITFERAGNGDIPYLLNKITVKDKSGHVVRSVQLDYEMPTKDSRHLLLKSVAVSGGSAMSADTKKYAFDYYLHSESDERKIYPDLYGYYHYGAYSDGTSNQDMPNYKNAYFDEQLKKIQVLTGANSVGMVWRDAVGNLYESGFPRWYNRTRQASDVPDSYALKTITYPTGGSVRYEYDANEIGGRYTGGLRVKKISSFAGNGTIPDIVTKYKYSGGVANINTELSYLHFIDQYYTANFYKREIVPQYGLQINRSLQISGNPILPELGDYKTGYERVEVTQHSGADENETLGKTVFGFEVPQEYHLNHFSASLYFYDYMRYPISFVFNNLYGNKPEFGTSFVDEYFYGYSPVLKIKQVFDKDNRLLRNESYYYQKKGIRTVTGVKTKRKIVFPQANEDFRRPTDVVRSQFDHSEYNIKGGCYRLTGKTVADYGPTDSVRVTEYYTYNDYNQLSFTDIVSDADGSLSKAFTYPWGNNGMKAANIVSPVINTVTRRSSVIIGQVKTNYPATAVNGMFLPLSVETASVGNLRTDLTYDKYDALGNLLQYTGIDGIPVVYLWGYSRSYPIAEIRNATYTQIAAILGETLIERVAAAIVPTGADLQQIDNLRSNSALKEAGVATYTYQPLVGMLSETSPSGQTTCYSYDDMGRLTETYIVEGGKKKLLQYNRYNYKNQ